ncbi:MAG: YwmB family TATA-box binding protein [Lachnotalea sp.]
MKKIMVFLIAAIWTFLGISYFLERNIVDDGKIVEAFSQTAFANEESVISIDGEYTGDYLGTDEAKALLSEIATALGIDQNYEITQQREEQRGELVLTKEAKRAQTTLKFITCETNTENNTLNATQYVTAEIKLYDTAECALAYRNMLEESLDNNQVTGDITVSLRGKYPGELSLEEKNVIADELLEKLDTNIKTEQRSDDIYVIYGYSKYISEFKEVGNQKINVSLAMNYNEEEKSTYIYLSTPLINEDY